MWLVNRGKLKCLNYLNNMTLIYSDKIIGNKNGNQS